jgi:DNA-binding response OmpR family regulator
MTSSIRYSSYPGIAPRATILFADDDADTREMMKALLRFEGFDVITAADGYEAVEIARRSIPQLILIDLELPTLDGIGVAKALKSDHRFKSVPIVMLSGHSPTRFRQQALDAGCEEYLLKPLDFSRLHELLERSRSVVKVEPQRRRNAVA